jgi:hypothetical protein
MSEGNLQTYQELFSIEVEAIPEGEEQRFEIPGDYLSAPEVQCLWLNLAKQFGLNIAVIYGCGDAECPDHKDNPVPHRLYILKPARQHEISEY